MSTIVLILWVGASASGSGGMALATVPGFFSRAGCEEAGQRAVVAFGQGGREARYVCVDPPNEPPRRERRP